MYSLVKLWAGLGEVMLFCLDQWIDALAKEQYSQSRIINIYLNSCYRKFVNLITKALSVIFGFLVGRLHLQSVVSFS